MHLGYSQYSKGYTIGQRVPWGGQQWDVDPKSDNNQVNVGEVGNQLLGGGSRGPAVAARARCRGHRLIAGAPGGRLGPPQVLIAAPHI